MMNFKATVITVDGESRERSFKDRSDAEYFVTKYVRFGGYGVVTEIATGKVLVSEGQRNSGPVFAHSGGRKIQIN